MENDKLFDLMTKMYSEFSIELKTIRSEFSTDLKTIKNEVQKNSSNIQKNSNNIEKILMLLENDTNRKIDALFDGYKSVKEQLTEIDAKVDKITQKVECQEVEIRVIKGGKA